MADVRFTVHGEQMNDCYAQLSQIVQDLEGLTQALFSAIAPVAPTDASWRAIRDTAYHVNTLGETGTRLAGNIARMAGRLEALAEWRDDIESLACVSKQTQEVRHA